jgi:sensor histidine kinase YesM
MNWDVYTRKIHWKIALIAFGTVIGLASLFYTESFLKELRAEEELKIKRWAEAVEAVFFAEDDANLSFFTQIIQDNTTIPVILTDSEGTIIAHRNLKTPESNPEKYLTRKLEEFKSSGSVLENSYADGQINFLYYKGSNLLTKLRLYPLILLGVIGVYMLISYMAFSNARRSEQNKVWTGMAKETAHQIGTPLSALMGWLAYLKEQYPQEIAFGEMEKDIDRLTDITDRFSKIGSQPERTDRNLDDTVARTVEYLRSRLGKKITLSLEMEGANASNHNQQLISWVLENMIKNSADAMDGTGVIAVEKKIQSGRAVVRIRDTGRGITPADQRKIFEPGFTSKNRGWGLGLSLAKRIVEEYHGGNLTLEQSIPGEGTTFTISLPLA